MILFQCSLFVYQVVKSIGILNRLKRYVPPNIPRTLYSAFILHFNFSFLNWGFKANRTRHQKMQVPTRCLIRGNGNTGMVTRGAQLGLCGLFVKTPLTIGNTLFEIDGVIIIPHNATFSELGQKPPFSGILWPLEGWNLTNVAQKRINSEHSSKQCTH